MFGGDTQMFVGKDRWIPEVHSFLSHLNPVDLMSVRKVYTILCMSLTTLIHVDTVIKYILHVFFKSLISIFR